MPEEEKKNNSPEGGEGEGKTEGEGKEKGEGEGKEEGKGTETEEMLKELSSLKGQNVELDTKNEELSGRVETLQDSLDSVLEELSLKGDSPKADNVGSPEGGGEGKTKEEGEGKTKIEEEGKTEEEGKATPIEKEIEESIKEEGEFRTEQQEQIEGLLTREAVRDLDNEVQSALKEYPNASEGEVLLAIEDGSEESVIDLAKTSHERLSKQKDADKTAIEGDLQERLKKEGEGGISVPQSPGSPPAPGTPKPGEQPPGSPGIPREETEWGDALGKAKVEGGGA